MPVNVTKEPDDLECIERCTDCDRPTRYWANDGEYPLCQKCAAVRPDVEPTSKITAVSCEIIRGLDGRLYVRSEDIPAMADLTNELNIPLASLDGHDNGFCISATAPKGQIAKMIDEIILIEPNGGAATDEPSLQDMVLGYYSEHYPEHQAEKLTREYFGKLKRLATEDA